MAIGDKIHLINKEEVQGAIGNINNPLLDLPLNNSLAMKQGVGSVEFTRSTTATYIDRYGVLKTAAVDEPRFEKDGLLIEGSSTNLKLYSKIDSANWVSSRSDIVENSAESPTGSTDASKVVYNEDGAIYLYRHEESVLGTYTASYFVKAGNTDGLFNISMHGNSFTNTRRVYFNLNDETFYASGDVTGSIEKLQDGWFRLSATATATVDNTGTPTYLDLLHVTNELAVDDYFYVYGAQLEKLPFATSYIPTTDSAVTRGVDFGTASAYNNVPDFSKGFSFVQDFVYGGPSTAAIVTQFNTVHSDALNKAYLFFRVANASSDITVHIANTAGLTIGSTLIRNATIGTKYRLAVTLDSAGMRGYVDGMLVFTQSGITQNDVLAYTNDRIFKFNGWGSSSNAGPLGKIHSENMRWYDRALTEQEVRLA